MRPDSKPPRFESKLRSYRSQHRQRSHADAHAGAEAAAPSGVLSHPLVPSGDPGLVADSAGVAGLIEGMRRGQRFAYDTEFIGEQTYRPKLCVIQIATPAHVTLIDPLTGVDLKPLWEVLADASVEKVVHAGLHDLEPVMRFLGRPPANVFDTQIAAAFIGLPYPLSTAKLVHSLAGQSPDAAPKFSQWDQRPLTSLQLRYAANDVRYLPLLRDVIGQRLQEAGNAQWAAEECASLSDPSLYQSDPDSLRLRIRGVG